MTDVLGYFPAWYREHGIDHFLLWQAEDPSDQDGVVVDQQGKALAFPSVAALEDFACRNDIHLGEGEMGLHDLDAVAAWLADPRPETVDCRELLNVLNLASDVSHSVGSKFSIYDYESDLNVVYDKLFWGANPPLMSAGTEGCDLNWSAPELQILENEATRALEIFRDHVAIIL